MVLLALLLVLIAGGASGGGSMAARIDAHYANAEVLQAGFEQLTQSSATRVTKTEKGRVLIVHKVGLLRFDYLSPDKKVFLYRSGLVEFFVPADKQLMRYRVDEDGQILPYLFLLGRKKLADCLAIPLGAERQSGADRTLLHLQPIAGGETGADFYVEADSSTGAVCRIVFFDDLRNRVEIRLSGERRASRLPPDADVISIPKGVEIVEQQ